MTSHIALKAVGRAIKELDSASFARPNDKTDDGATWTHARSLLMDILDRNGYELAQPGSSRIRKKMPEPKKRA